ncbi:DUF58 domain-containing protein [Dactylosporangium sp. NPDC049525]|uniref:DUF58 domain-containing protein n=1 Tax=Dactylosporangium sp. NPDC049525 TaxID=3154730 RepID=UPI003432F260
MSEHRRFTVTPTGIAATAGAAALYAAGVLLGYPTFVGIAVGTLAMLAAGLLTVAVRPAVTLSRRISPQRLSVGEEATARITVTNRSRLPALPFTAVDRVGERDLTIPVPPLAAGAERELTCQVPAHRRGRLRLGPLTVQRRDPFGLFVWAERQAADGVLWVHPRVHPLPALHVGTVLDYEGRSTDTPRLGTVTFTSLRDYVPGDDPRRIHWKSTARVGTLIVKEHVDTTEPTTTVVLDTGCADPALFEHAVEVAASVARAVEDLGRPVALRLSGAVAQEPSDAVSTMDRLALATAAGTGTDPAQLLNTINRAQPGGALVVVTGPVEPGMLGRLADQRRRFSPVVVASVVPDAPAGPRLRRRPGLALLTGGTAAELVAVWHRLVRGEGGEA